MHPQHNNNKKNIKTTKKPKAVKVLQLEIRRQNYDY
jgi:hypothetical protein